MPRPCGWRCAAARATSWPSRSSPKNWSRPWNACATSRRAAARRARADVIVVLGAAGGVGTSLVACNLALALATETRAPTLLLDLDVNAAPLASFLDLAPERGLPAALAEVEYLDEQALPGYVAKHRSGLRLMGAPAKSLVSAEGHRPRALRDADGPPVVELPLHRRGRIARARRPERGDDRHGADGRAGRAAVGRAAEAGGADARHAAATRSGCRTTASWSWSTGT